MKEPRYVYFANVRGGYELGRPPIENTEWKFIPSEWVIVGDGLTGRWYERSLISGEIRPLREEEGD